MVSCVRCIAVSSEVQLQDTGMQSDSDEYSDSESEEYDDEDYDLVCDECCQRRLIASVDDFPETVLSVLEDAALSMNSGFVNWVFKHKSMRVLSVLTMPYILPIDIARAAFGKFRELVPKVGKDLGLVAEWIVCYIKKFIEKFSEDGHLYGAKFSCQLAITEYNFSDEQPIPKRPRSSSVIPRSTNRRSSYSHHRPLSGEWGPCPHRAKRNQSPGSRRMSCMNFGFTVDLASSKISSSAKHPLATALDANKMEEKVVDFANAALLNLDPHAVNRTDHAASLHPESADTFEQVLNVTREHEAMLAYYYLDENNHLKVTELFDLSKPETPILSPEEYATNRKLEWDESCLSELSLKNDSDFYGVYSEDLIETPNVIIDSGVGKSYLTLVDPSSFDVDSTVLNFE